ncbi:hypothetical protein OBBRIDRAFT_835855 [Obba rivulosa]|uniref:Uncharacterized protein n=1 Tax=Obba rivulosa TaxID=1052685 RepID=A0A8E2AWJ1_9APHY|nr:hypothetical protein OBBRIDRAFT_835855 [Obba rivulosa]
MDMHITPRLLDLVKAHAYHIRRLELRPCGSSRFLASLKFALPQLEHLTLHALPGYDITQISDWDDEGNSLERVEQRFSPILGHPPRLRELSLESPPTAVVGEMLLGGTEAIVDIECIAMWMSDWTVMTWSGDIQCRSSRTLRDASSYIPIRISFMNRDLLDPDSLRDFNEPFDGALRALLFMGPKCLIEPSRNAYRLV